MSRSLLLFTVVAWAGATLLVSTLRPVARRSLTERLRPHEPGAGGANRDGVLSVESFSEVIAPLARSLGSRASRLLGVGEELGVRLERVHSPLDVTAFRLRQVGAAALSGVVGIAAAAALSAPVALGAFVLLGAPVLAFLLIEQHLATVSERWQRRIFLELPVIAEQLGMLLSAGFSLGAALGRLAERGDGACATDLRRVRRRVAQGLSEVDALREWAVIADVPELDRLIAVLALNSDAGDLGGLIAEEARSVRREVQRETIESIERKAQQVWIPVTVATLVPGVIFMAVPFVDAMSAFSGGAP